MCSVVSCYLSPGVVVTLETVLRDVVTEVPGLTGHTGGVAVCSECSRAALCLTLRPGPARLTQTGPINLQNSEGSEGWDRWWLIISV